jgi:hypothetical protein
MPPIVLYGANAELRSRETEEVEGRFESIATALYGPDMAIVRIPSTR